MVSEPSPHLRINSLSRQPEARFKSQVLKRLRQIPNSYWQAMNPAWIAGIPDIIGCYRGIYWALELKMEWGKLSPKQSHEISKISRAGGKTAVVTPRNFDLIFDEIVAA